METRQVEQLKLNVTNIKSFLVSSNKESQKISAQKSSLIKRQEQSEKRKLKEKSIESVPGSGTAGNIFSKITSPATSFLDKILNFAGSILLGVIVNNLPAIIAKAEEVINVVKPLWEGAVKTIGFIFNTSKTIFESVVSFFNPKKVESETQEVTAELNSLEKELDFDENILGNLGPLPSEEEFEQDEVGEITEKVPEPVKTIIPVIPFNPPEPQKRNEGGEIIRTTQPNQSPPKSSENVKHPFQRLYNNVHMNRKTLELYEKNINEFGRLIKKLEEGQKNIKPKKSSLDFVNWTQIGNPLAMIDSTGPLDGSVISVSHPETGSGYGIDGVNDYKGRPATFSKHAASAFARMMRDSGGIVKGVDIASSQRSPEYNAQIGGAKNSHHMYGNAMDIHGSSNSWIRTHGGKYGWYINDYPGSHGGHFVFRGVVKPKSKSGDPPDLVKPIKKSSSIPTEMEGSSSTEIIIIPVEVAKPIPVNTGSNNGSTILNTSKPRTSNSLHNIP